MARAMQQLGAVARLWRSVAGDARPLPPLAGEGGAVEASYYLREGVDCLELRASEGVLGDRR